MCRTSARICARRKCGWRWKATRRGWPRCGAPTNKMRKIVEAHATFAEGLAQGRVSAEADLAFHASIAEASGNDFFPGRAGNASMNPYSGFMRAVAEPDAHRLTPAPQRVMDEHASILAAIREQDGERGRDRHAVPSGAGPLSPGGSRPRLTSVDSAIHTANDNRRRGSGRRTNVGLRMPAAHRCASRSSWCCAPGACSRTWRIRRRT